MVLGALLAMLILYAIVASFRNRKSFTLEDEDDGIISKGADSLHGGVLRSESGPEGSKGVLA